MPSLPSVSNPWPRVCHRRDPAFGLIFTRPIFCKIDWVLRPAFLHKGPRSNTLFAGPWVGEFGWELLNWQAWVRALAPSYERVIVCAKESSRALYHDFATDFIPHTLQGVANTHSCLDPSPKDELARILADLPAGADHLQPRKYVPATAQHFIRMGCVNPEYSTDVFIHARGRDFVKDRNWNPEQWHELCHSLQSKGLRVAALGLSGDTLKIEGIDDYRDRPLQETLDRIASARLVIGPSSGPLHLASLCGTPHLVWTDRRTYGMRKTSREKYETFWNPLQTPVTILDQYGFKPPVDAVLQALEQRLKT